MCFSKIFDICKIFNICNSFNKKNDINSIDSYELNKQKFDKLDKIITDKLNSIKENNNHDNNQ
jgi:hypothetical protein